MHKGRCLCGNIAFAVDGPPNDIINCHCYFCQRATGSAYLVETMFDIDKFHLLGGTPRIYHHISAGSGQTIHIHFCKDCGTKTHMRFDRFPTSVGVFSGTFDQPDWFERTHDTALHFFLSTAPKGTVLPAGYAVYDAHYWQADGIAATPQILDTNLLVTEDVRTKSRERLRGSDLGEDTK
jgi:hypothetical protein